MQGQDGQEGPVTAARRKEAGMPAIYGVGKSGRIHRKAQPLPEPPSAPAWLQVMAGGELYATPHAVDVAMGWRAGAAEDTLSTGEGKYRGVELEWADAAQAGRGGRKRPRARAARR